MKRVFVGIKIKELQQEAAVFKSKFNQLPVRWIADEDLHITLIAPWEATDEEIEKIKDKLSNTNFVRPFEASFKKITYGPDLREPRLIWAEGEASKGIIELSKKIGESLGRQDNRPFLLHLTLARFRPEKFSVFPIKNLNEEINWKERIEGFDLIESILLPEGVRYGVLGEFEL